MEREWERNEPPLVLDREAIEAKVAGLGLRLSEATLVEGGKANTTYRIETEEGRFALRVLQRDPRGQAVEAALAERVAHLVPTPRLAGQGQGFLLFEWRDGTTLERALTDGLSFPYARIARQLAEVRLALDAVRFDAPGLFNGGLTVTAPWKSAVAGWFGYGRLLLQPPACDPDFASRVESLLDAAQPRIEAIAGPPTLVHGDFKASNLLVDENGLVAVLDWEFAHAGTRLADVGQLLRFSESLPPGFVPSFLSALGLDGDAMRLAQTLDVVNLLDLYTVAPIDSLMKRELSVKILQTCDRYEARSGPLP